MARPKTAPPPPPLEKLCTLYVGKIPDGVDDPLIVRLLECCGRVTKWKRTSGLNGKPKGFGFVDFHTADAVLRAMKLLPPLAAQLGGEVSALLT